MIKQKNIIVITGKVGSGKSSFLKKITSYFQKSWCLDGIISFSKNRFKENASLAYEIEVLATKEKLLWATRESPEALFTFNQDTLTKLKQHFANLDKKTEVIILDDIGYAELYNQGLQDIFQSFLHENDLPLIVTIKQSALEQIKQKFNFSPTLLIDLNETSAKEALLTIQKILAPLDAEKIGIFATTSGIMEITVGSIMNVIRNPFRPTVMPLLQNFLLILFAKELKGRGTFWIVFISAGLKSFSPMGSKLKPMLYITVQGLSFWLPQAIIGWNFISAFIGSLMLGLSTMVLSLILDYITFGMAIIDSYINSFDFVFKWLNIPSISFFTVLAIMALIKIVMFSIMAPIAYFYDFSAPLKKWLSKVDEIDSKQIELLENPTWIQSLKGALKDISLKFFVIPFIFSALLIFFFSNLSTAGFIQVMMRGLLISWFGFLIARRINFVKIIKFLKKRKLDHIANSLDAALKKVQAFRDSKQRK